MDDRGMNQEVVVDELRRPGCIRKDASDRSRDQEDVFGTIGPEPVVHGRLVAQIELLPAGGDHVIEAFLGQPPHDARSDETSVATDKYARRSIHSGHIALLSAGQ
jgi:hypothetical protein